MHNNATTLERFIERVFYAHTMLLSWAVNPNPSAGQMICLCVKEKNSTHSRLSIVALFHIKKKSKFHFSDLRINIEYIFTELLLYENVYTLNKF